MATIHALHHQTGKLLDFITNNSEDAFLECAIEHDLNGELIATLRMPSDLPQVEAFTDRGLFLVPDEDAGFMEFIIHNIEQTDEETTVYGVGSYVDLNKRNFMPPGTVKSKNVVEYGELIFPGTGWQLGENEFNTYKTVTNEEYEGMYAYLRRVATAFGAELRFRVETSGNRITGRFVDFLIKEGENTKKEIVLGKDLLGVRIEKNSEAIVTALFCVGPERTNGGRYQEIVYDDVAFQNFNIDNQHIIEVYMPESSDADMTRDQLRAYGKKELNKRIASIYTYEVTAEVIETEYPHEKTRIGDQIRVKNKDFKPPLYADARIVRIVRYIGEDDRKEYSIGEVKTYTENEILRNAKKFAKMYASKVVRQDTPPAGSKEVIWIQTNVTLENGQKVEIPHTWDGVTWQKASPTEAAEVGAATPGEVETAKEEAIGHADAGDAELASDIADITKALGDFQGIVNTTFKDGIIEEAEAKSIEKYKNSLAAEKGDNDSRYTSLYGNAHLEGAPKTALAAAKTNYNSAYTALISAVDTAIADKKTTAAEKTAVDNAFATYRTRYAEISTAFENATNAIAAKKAALAEAEALRLANIEIQKASTANQNFVQEYAQGKIQQSETPPLNPKVNQLWIDNSDPTKPPVWKTWTGTAWKNASATSLADLNGQLADAQIAVGSIAGNKLVDNAITEAKIALGAITELKIGNGAITNAKLAALAVDAAKLAAGAVTDTKIAEGAVLTGKLADLAITAGKLAENAVTETKIGPAAITNAKLKDLAVDAAKLAAGSVTETKVGPAAITSTKLADLAVEAAKLANGAVTETKLADNAVTVNKVLAGAITEAKIAANAVTELKINPGAITNSRLADLAIDAAKLANGAVTTTKILDDAINSAKLAANAVTELKINPGAVTNTRLANLAVDAAKLAANAVTEAKIADNAVTVNKVLAGAITEAKIAAGAVTELKIGNGAITTGKLADLAVDAAKLKDSAVTATKIANLAVGTAAIADAAITNAKIKELDAAKITTGRLDAARIQIGSGTMFADGFDPTKIEIGGRNLVINSTFNFGDWNNAYGGFLQPEEDKPNSRIAFVRTTYEGTSIASPLYNTKRTKVNIPAGSTIIISMDIKIMSEELRPTSTIFTLRKATAASGGTVTSIFSPSIDMVTPYTEYGKWQRVNCSLKLTTPIIDEWLVFGLYAANNVAGKTSEIFYREIKAEVGTKATDWTPAPEDTTAEIAAAKTAAETAAAADAAAKASAAETAAKTAAALDAKTKADAAQAAAITAAGTDAATKAAAAEKAAKEYALAEAAAKASAAETAAKTAAAADAKTKADAAQAAAISAAKTYSDSAVKPANDRLKLWQYMDTTFINGGNIYTNSVTANQIAVGTITAASGLIADAAITTAKIADAAITSVKIGQAAIGTAAIQDAAITNAKIKELDAAKITTGLLNAARVQIGSGTTYATGYDPTTKETPTGAQSKADAAKTAAISAAATDATTKANAAETAAKTAAASDAAAKASAAETAAKTAAAADAKAKADAAQAAAITAAGSDAATKAAAAEKAAKEYALAEAAAKASAAETAAKTAAAADAKTKADAAQAAAIAAAKTYSDAAVKPANDRLTLWQYSNTTLIDGGNIYANTVTANQIATGTITAASGIIADAAITTAKIANAAIGTAAIADAAITNAKIKDLDATKITTGRLDAARIQIGSGTQFAAGFDPTTKATPADVDTKISGLVIDGKNILLNSDFSQDFLHWGKQSYTNLLPPEDDKPNAKILQIERAVVSTVSTGVMYTSDRYYLNPKPGDSITFSFDFFCEDLAVYGPNSTIFTMRRYAEKLGGSASSVANLNLAAFGITESGKWIRGSYTYNFSSTTAVAGWYVFGPYMSQAANTAIRYKYRQIKIENGNRATSWTPAPEDAIESIGIAVKPANDRLTLWQYADTTFIDGGRLYANSVTANEIKTGTITAASGLLADAAITTAKIADAAITTAKINNLAVGTAAIADAAITDAKINNLAVTNAKIALLAVDTAQIASAAITSAKIANLAVGNAAIANLAVDTAKIQDLAITNAKIAALAVDTAKINDAAITSAKIVNLAVGTAAIANAAITEAKINDLAVTTAKIASAAITTAKIANLAVGTAAIADAAITNAKIKDLDAAKITTGFLGAARIAANTITTTHIAANAITSVEIKAATITATELATDSVTATQIKAGAVTAAAIAANSITSNMIATAGLDAAVIKFGTMSGDRIAANTITSTQINVTTLSAISANLGNVSAGTIDGVTFTSGIGSGTEYELKNGFARFTETEMIGTTKLVSEAILTNGRMSAETTYGGVSLYSSSLSAERMALSSKELNAMTIFSSDQIEMISGASDVLTVAKNKMYIVPTQTYGEVSDQKELRLSGAGNTLAIKDKTLRFNGMPIAFSDSQIIAEGVWWMTDKHTVTPSRSLMECPNGWILVWSRFVNGAHQNSDWNFTIVPKTYGTMAGGTGMWAILAAASVADNLAAPPVAYKYIYPRNTYLTGHVRNGSGTESGQCLRYILAF